ncbi:MAG: prepilin-type N-terminal cleavage/methylation domain-containing protein [Deltaproteobacteria bacterium]|nr:prepilin-type N-terminal cleavage/methylation domain-containing protein [Deltaproteobacteria bacterium]
MRTSVSRVRRSAGFTLIEVAIAMAIVGVGVVAVLQIFTAALRTERAAGVRARAAMQARALLEQTMTEPDPAAGQDSGELPGGYRYERRVREATELLEGSGRQLDVKSDITIFEIEVSVLWAQAEDREGVYTVRTLRVGPSPQA